MSGAAMKREDTFDAFRRALRGVSGTCDERAEFDALVAAYAEPHRAYHTLAHIDACLSWLDWHWSLAERPHEIALAIFFHDVVYEPLAKDNEAKSAAWAERVLRGACVAEEVVARVTSMILATRAHGPCEGDEALLVSIDLAILGAAPPAYARFERDVRSEYRAVDDATYARGRIHVLESLAARAPLYPHPAINMQLEKRARRNIERTVADLRPSAAAHT